VIVIHLLLMCAFCYVCLFSINKKGGALYLAYKGNPFFVLLAIYMLSAVSSLFVDQDLLPYFNMAQHSFFSYLIYTASLLVMLAPIVLFKGFKFTSFTLDVGYGVYFFYLGCSILILFSFVYQVPYALKAISFGALEVREGLNVDGQGVLPQNIFTTIAVVTSSFYVVFIFMFFFSLYKGMSLYFKLTMFLGSSLYVVSSLAFTARDGALFWIFTMFFVFYLFEPVLDEKLVRRFKAILFVGSLGMLFVLASFTAQRFFSDGDTDRLLSGTVGYIGQQPYVFAETILKQEQFYGLDLRFPLISSFFGGDGAKVQRYEVYEWTFGTLAKDFYAVNGYFSLVILVALIALPFTLYFRKRRVNPVLYLLVMGFYFQLMSTGVFYFRLGTRGGNLYIILFFALMFVLMLFLSRNSIRREAI